MLEALGLRPRALQAARDDPEGADRRRRPSRAGPSTPRPGRIRRSRRKVQQVATPRVVAGAGRAIEKQARAEAMAAVVRVGVGSPGQCGSRAGRAGREGQGARVLREGREGRGAAADRGQGHPRGRAQRQGGAADLVEVGVPAAGPRLGALHARRDRRPSSSATLGTKDDEQKMESFEGDTLPALHAALQLPLVLDGRGEALRHARPPRDRPRRARPARHRGACCRPKKSSRTRSAIVSRSSSPTARRRWPRCAALRWR